ncbi:hypothetical protein AB0L64_23675 [Kribbella sp. NPDC051936]|uniref:hypothetical protein n=1 Tax=Kribbella sp. NPDC051936 TaxID=3154946 RepID=UPI003412CDF4
MPEVPFEVHFPDYLEGYEFETEAKGYLTDVVVRSGVRQWRLTVYDVVRLNQEVSDEVRTSGACVLSDTLVVSKVTRQHVIDALNSLAESNFAELD